MRSNDVGDEDEGARRSSSFGILTAGFNESSIKTDKGKDANSTNRKNAKREVWVR